MYVNKKTLRDLLVDQETSDITNAYNTAETRTGIQNGGLTEKFT